MVHLEEADALVWDDNLSYQATEYAEHLTSANIFEHSCGPYDPAPKEESVHNIGKEERGGDGSAALDQMNPPIIMGRR